SQSARVKSVLPLLLIAMRERVAVPPEVAGGTTTMAYVPPLNGMSCAWPLSVTVHAAAPVEAENALSVVVIVPSELRTLLSAMTLPSDTVTCARALTVAVQPTVPLGRTAGLVVV